MLVTNNLQFGIKSLNILWNLSVKPYLRKHENSQRNNTPKGTRKKKEKQNPMLIEGRK